MYRGISKIPPYFCNITLSCFVVFDFLDVSEAGGDLFSFHPLFGASPPAASSSVEKQRDANPKHTEQPERAHSKSKSEIDSEGSNVSDTTSNDGAKKSRQATISYHPLYGNSNALKDSVRGEKREAPERAPTESSQEEDDDTDMDGKHTISYHPLYGNSGALKDTVKGDKRDSLPQVPSDGEDDDDERQQTISYHPLFGNVSARRSAENSRSAGGKSVTPENPESSMSFHPLFGSASPATDSATISPFNTPHGSLHVPKGSNEGATLHNAMQHKASPISAVQTMCVPGSHNDSDEGHGQRGATYKRSQSVDEGTYRHRMLSNGFSPPLPPGVGVGAQERSVSESTSKGTVRRVNGGGAQPPSLTFIDSPPSALAGAFNIRSVFVICIHCMCFPFL